MAEKDYLEMAQELEDVEDLSSEDRNFVKQVIELLRDEKRLLKKDRAKLLELHKEFVGEKEGSNSDDDVDEDDFV